MSLQDELGPTIDDLVGVAQAAGMARASRRTIRHWVRSRLVSAPARSGQRWLYPVCALGETEAVVRWRQRGASLDEARFAVFVEIGSGSQEAAVAFVREFVARWAHGVAAAAAEAAATPELVEETAILAARKRGTAALPHRVRGVSLDERTLAASSILNTLLGTQAGPEVLAAGQFQLERVFGLRSGRGGRQRDLNDLTIRMSEVSHDPAELLDALERATPGRVELARRAVELMGWASSLRGTFLSYFGPAFTPFIDIVCEWTGNLTPDAYALVAATLIRNGLQHATEDQIAAALQSFSASLFAAVVLAEQPENERRVAIRRLRPYQGLQLERAIAHVRKAST